MSVLAAGMALVVVVVGAFSVVSLLWENLLENDPPADSDGLPLSEAA